MQPIEYLLVFSVTFSIISFFVFAGYFVWNRKVIISWFRKKILRRLSREFFITAKIIMPNKQIMTFYTTISPDSDYTFMKCRYIVDPKFIQWENKLPCIYHFYGIPNPIHFDASSQQVTINSENYHTLMKQKLVRDLLSENNLLKIILIVSIVGCVISMIIAMKLFGVFDKKEPSGTVATKL